MIWNESKGCVANIATDQSITSLMGDLNLDARPYQVRIAAKATQMLQGRFRRGNGDLDREVETVMVDSPTGSGKTVMGLMVARWMQQQFGFSIGWVANRNELFDQVQTENEHRGFCVDLEPIGLFDKNPPQVDVLILDEVQHEAVNSMANLHSRVMPRKSIGLAATSFRNERLKLYFERIVKDVGIHTLIQDGYLSRYRHFLIPDFDPYTVASTYLKEPKRWGKSIMFFHRLEQCLECQKLLTDAGAKSQIVTANSNQEHQLDCFAAGDIDVLINKNVWSGGFDSSDLKTVFCRPSTRSCTIEMGGRVLRKHADLPLKQIVQSKDTRHPFVNTAMADEQFVWTANGWKSSTLNSRYDSGSSRPQHTIAGRTTKCPKIVAARQRQKIRWHFQIAESA